MTPNNSRSDGVFNCGCYRKLTVERDVLAFEVRQLVQVLPQPITGRTAMSVASLVYLAGLDHSTQRGNAYLRCPACGEGVYDLQGGERFNANTVQDRQGNFLSCDCDHDYMLEDLRISEGWVEELANDST